MILRRLSYEGEASTGADDYSGSCMAKQNEASRSNDAERPNEGNPRRRTMDTTTLLIIILVILLLGGGGWYGRGRWY